MKSLAKENGHLETINTLMEDLLSKDLFDWSGKNYAAFGSTLPGVNIRETNTEFLIDLAAPGMEKKDFHVELSNNVLTISSEKEGRKEKKKKDHYFRNEFSYNAFTRSFTLPSYADETKISASYKEGILHVTVAKRNASAPKSKKTIQIK